MPYFTYTDATVLAQRIMEEVDGKGGDEPKLESEGGNGDLLVLRNEISEHSNS